MLSSRKWRRRRLFSRRRLKPRSLWISRCVLAKRGSRVGKDRQVSEALPEMLEPKGRRDLLVHKGLVGREVSLGRKVPRAWMDLRDPRVCRAQPASQAFLERREMKALMVTGDLGEMREPTVCKVQMEPRERKARGATTPRQSERRVHLAIGVPADRMESRVRRVLWGPLGSLVWPGQTAPRASRARVECGATTERAVTGLCRRMGRRPRRLMPVVCVGEMRASVPTHGT
mmetsp:Transcript_37338/g.76585  ORF Transcript_37338/g.76585 Transcript_37338/m.76585 type:complete len:230 (+) Transcript_37338:483-1172(+)